MNYIEEVYSNISIKEDKNIIKNYLLFVFIYERISNKKLSSLLNIPIPLVVAIKREFMKVGILTQKGGITLTQKGNSYVSDELNLAEMDKESYLRILSLDYDFEAFFNKELVLLEKMFKMRPSSDLELDQTECTPKSSLKRAVLALQNNSLLNKKILCIGDDDLVSISIILILKRIFKDISDLDIKITIVDIDSRILHSLKLMLEKLCFEAADFVKHDLREPLPASLLGKFDTVFTDPPYTENGLKLFLLRAKAALTDNKSGKLYLSFAEKDDEFNYFAQTLFLNLNFIIDNIYNSFNQYNGAGIIGSRSNMIVLSSLRDKTNMKFTQEIYTGKVSIKNKRYKCKKCKKIFELGEGKKYRFIEELKNDKCHVCGSDSFQLLKSIKVN